MTDSKRCTCPVGSLEPDENGNWICCCGDHLPAHQEPGETLYWHTDPDWPCPTCGHIPTKDAHRERDSEVEVQVCGEGYTALNDLKPEARQELRDYTAYLKAKKTERYEGTFVEFRAILGREEKDE